MTSKIGSPLLIDLGDFGVSMSGEMCLVGREKRNSILASSVTEPRMNSDGERWWRRTPSRLTTKFPLSHSVRSIETVFLEEELEVGKAIDGYVALTVYDEHGRLT